MFTLWYSVLSFKEYRNSVCSGNTSSKTNGDRSSSPKPVAPTLPVQIPKAKVPDIKDGPMKPVPIRPTPAPSSPMPIKSPIAPLSPSPRLQSKISTPSSPSISPSRFQQDEPEKKQAPGAQISQQFLKRENSYSSSSEEEDDEEEEDSEIERIDLHK